MTRRKTKPEDIQNPEHYFNRYIALETRNQMRANAKKRKNEVSIEEKSQFTSFHVLTAVNKNNEMFASVESTVKYCEWVNDSQLLCAMEELTDEERFLLKRYFYDEATQKELSEEFKVSQQAISKTLQRLYKKLKEFFG